MLYFQFIVLEVHLEEYLIFPLLNMVKSHLGRKTASAEILKETDIIELRGIWLIIRYIFDTEQFIFFLFI